MKIKISSLLLIFMCLPAMAAQGNDGYHRGQEQAPTSFKLLHRGGNCADGPRVEGILVLDHLANTISLTRSNCQDISPQDVDPTQVQHSRDSFSDADILIYQERLYLASSSQEAVYFCIGNSGAADWPVTQVTARHDSGGEQMSLSLRQQGNSGTRGSGVFVQLKGSTYSGNGDLLTGPNNHVSLTYDSASSDGFRMNANVSFQFEVSNGVCHVGLCPLATGTSIPLICYLP